MAAGAGSELLAGDRNVTGTSSQLQSCTYFQSAGRLPPLTAGWNLALHAEMGHLLLSAGEVEFVAPNGLQRIASQNYQTNSDIHLLVP